MLTRSPAVRGTGDDVALQTRREAATRHWSIQRATRRTGPSGSLLGTAEAEVQVGVFGTSCERCAVLPKWGKTELFQPQGFRQGLLRQSLFGEHGGDPVRPFLALGRVEQDKLLDLPQLV